MASFPRRPGAVRRLPRAGKTFAFLVTCWGPWPKSPATAWVGLALVCALFTLAWVGASLSLKPGTSETWQGGGGGTTQPAGGWQRARILCPYLKVGTRFVWVPALWSLRGVVPLCPVEACPLWWPGQRAQKRVLLLAATSANPLPPLPTHASARSAAQPRWARTHRRTVGTTWAVGQVPLAHSIAGGPVARLNSFCLVFPACLCGGGVEVSCMRVMRSTCVLHAWFRAA